MSFVVIAWTAVAVTAASAGYSAYNAEAQKTDAKKAAGAAADQQNKLIKAAEDKSASEESTANSAIGRARMKALAAATAATGRSSTIKTGQQGLIGEAPGTTKNLIGE